MLIFHKTTPPETAAKALFERLADLLNHQHNVLWLVPGGSNIRLSAAIMNNLPPELTGYLTIMLTDERYGPLNHPDSNMFQLAQAGFRPGKAKVIPTLNGDKNLADTTLLYATNFAKAATSADIIVGQFGIGADGHIAGMKPHSPAVTIDTLTAGYKWDDFTRITLTPAALARIDEAYAFVYGEEKHAALEVLQTQNLPLDDQPAQILKSIPKAYVYNDAIEGETK